jgi:hypothetical protein
MHSIMKFFVIAFFASALSLINLTVYAGQGNSGGGKGHGVGHGHGHSKSHGKGHAMGKAKHGKSVNANAVSKKTHGPAKKAVFSNTDRNTIVKYFNKNPISANTLPPGIAMNLARGKPLPPGIAKRTLPPELISTLPVRPGYEYLAVGNDVVLVNTTTDIIADVISNVLK